MRSLLCLLAFSFSIQTHALTLNPLPPAQTKRLLRDMSHHPLQQPVQQRHIIRAGGCVLSAMDVPVVNPNDAKIRILRVFLTRPVGKHPRPAVLIVPTIEGHTVMEDNMATSLCSQGFVAVVADVNSIEVPHVLPGWDLENKKARWAIHALRTTLDAMEMDPGILRGRIGAMGLSLGGITTATLAGIDSRLKAMIIVAGGGNFPHILAFSAYSKVRDLREARMRALGIRDPRTYEQMLRKSIRYDPIYFARGVDPHRVWMALVKNDEAVPESSQVELWQALGRPTKIWLDHSHIQSVMRFGFLHMRTAGEFFRSRLGLD